MKPTEVTEELIGKRCKSIFTGRMVTGTIEDVTVNKYTAEVKVRFDKPHRWGNETHKFNWSHARLHDEFGSLKYLEIIDHKYQAIRVEFDKPIREIDKMFVDDYKIWNVVNLKEWIDSYESSRFTEICERTAIITSEYNMDCVKEWLMGNAFVKTIKSII